MVVLQRMGRTCSQVHAACAACLFSLAQPIKFLICGVVVAVPVMYPGEEGVCREALFNLVCMGFLSTPPQRATHPSTPPPHCIL